MALESQPMYQREMQKAYSKASMRGNRLGRPKTEALQSRLADMDLARKLAFGQIGLAKERSDLVYSGKQAAYKRRKRDLRDRENALPWTIGIGAGTGILSALEGRRRAGLIADQAQLEQDRYVQTQDNTAQYRNDMRTRWGLPAAT